jgi:hypothetical protein
MFVFAVTKVVTLDLFCGFVIVFFIVFNAHVYVVLVTLRCSGNAIRDVVLLFRIVSDNGNGDYINGQLL